MFIVLNIIWFIWELKYILFWLYLWQLKEYHIGRFVDHFRTYKGKKIIFDFIQISKIILLGLFLLAGFILNFWISILFIIYLLQTIVFLKGIIKNTFKKPAITLKIIFLSFVSFALLVAFSIWAVTLKDYLQPICLLLFDILTPITISVIVILFQPFFVMIRNRTLSKAKIKMEKIKALSAVTTIVVTGSYGKTSTKEFLSSILSKKFKVLSTKEHQNSEIGIANCILNDLKPSHEIFIAEVGAYNKGKIKEVCSVIKPKIGIVTGVNEQHLALFGSLKNLLSAEGGGELAESLPENGILFVNGDNKYCLDLYKKSGKGTALGLNTKIYSLTNKVVNSDIWSENITTTKDYVSFVAFNKLGEMAHFSANVLGKQNVQNLLGAILVAKELGMSFEEISEACKEVSPKLAGMIVKKGKHGINIIDSSYSSNPDGVFADLEYMSIFKGKKVIVMPCLIELGKKSSEIHEKIGRKIGKNCELAIITSKDKFKDIESGFNKKKINIKSRCLLCDKTEDIYSLITLFCKSGDTVLMEGRVPAGLINLLTEDN